MNSYFGLGGHSFEFAFQLSREELVSGEEVKSRDCDRFSSTFQVPVKILRKGILEELKEGKCA